MKKKLLGFVLALCLAVLSVMPAFAAESDDPAVQQSITAYEAMQTALEAGNVDDLRTSSDAFTAANEALSEEQQEELMSLIGDTFWDVVWDASCVISAADAYDAYVADPSIENSMTLVEMYDYAVYAELAIDTMIPGIAEAYEAATAMVPSENVLAVYDAMNNLTSQIEFPYFLEDFATAIEEFEDALKLYEEFTEEELEAFVELSGLTEESVAIVPNLLETGKLVYKAASAYDTFGMNGDKESAEAFIATYEEIILNADIDDGVKDCIYTAYEDYDDVYAIAKELLAEDDSQSGDDQKDDAKDNQTNESPKTGDPVTLLVLAGAAAAGAVYARKRR